ncbi:MAG: hypothetical protein M3O31_11300 [Acidobacteriota bacterium]|nr:hypothetical protein [Acidobacteriota bacterium]
MEGEDETPSLRRLENDLKPKRAKVVEISQSFVAKKPILASSIDVSASSSPGSAALDEDNLRLVVQRIVNYGEIKESFHSASERDERDVSQDDIVAMLERNWRLTAEPDWDQAHRNWEYKLAGTDLEGDELVLKITVNEEMQRITIITKY